LGPSVDWIALDRVWKKWAHAQLCVVVIGNDELLGNNLRPTVLPVLKIGDVVELSPSLGPVFKRNVGVEALN